MEELETKLKDATMREMSLRLKGNYLGAKQERARIKNIKSKIAHLKWQGN